MRSTSTQAPPSGAWVSARCCPRPRSPMAWCMSGARPGRSTLSMQTPELWSVDTPGTRESTPAVASGMVYYATGDASANYLSAFDAQTGATLWQDSAGIPFVFSPSLLAVAGGTVYLYDGELYAYAASTGA